MSQHTESCVCGRNQVISRRRSGRRAVARATERALFETLEGRQMLATWAVTIDTALQQGQTANTNTGTATLISTRVEAADWKAAVEAVITGQAKVNGSITHPVRNGGTFNSASFDVDLASVIGSNSTYPGEGALSEEWFYPNLVDKHTEFIPLDPNQKVVGFEDGTDADFNDAYWKVYVQEITPKMRTECTPCGGCVSIIQEDAGTDSGGYPSTSSYPIQYDNGVLRHSVTDLSSANFGTAWSHTRSWTNNQQQYTGNTVGHGFVLSERPQLLKVGTDIQAVLNGYSSIWFTGSGVNYTAQLGSLDKLTVEDATTSDEEFILFDTTGGKAVFYGFDDEVDAGRLGQLKSYKDSSGHEMTVTYDSSTDRVTSVSRTENSVAESFVYDYVDGDDYTGGANEGLIKSVTLQRTPQGGSATVVRQVQYTYYVDSDLGGMTGDLKYADVQDGSGTSIDKTYYRWYEPTITSGKYYAPVNGQQHMLKMVFGPASFARLAAEVSGIDSASDATIAKYADNYFEYDHLGRVTKEIAQGAGCSSCSAAAGSGTFSLAYFSQSASGYNHWASKTVETLNDDNEKIVYANIYGQPMLEIVKNVTTGAQWGTYRQYDSAGRVILLAHPSAVDLPSNLATLEQYGDLLNMSGDQSTYLKNDSGVIETFTYATSTTATTSTAGDVTGYLKSSSIKRGDNTGAGYLQQTLTYIKREPTTGSITYHLATVSRYRNETADPDDSSKQTTTYIYNSWHGDTHQVKSLTVRAPVVTANQNGPGTATETTTVYDVYGRPIWYKDEAGSISYTEYDDAKGGGVKKSIVDVKYSSLTTAEQTSFATTGWSQPQQGLHLATQYDLDDLGRVTKMTDPENKITYTHYQDIDDATHDPEVRVYRGWTGTTTTGPIEVTRIDRARGYTETLTMSVTPVDADEDGVPDGTESISNIQSLSRSYTNTGGQVVMVDVYHNIPTTYTQSTTFGSVGDNFYRTEYGYEKRGRQAWVKGPEGTITHTFYDVLGRVTSTWVGTDDVPDGTNLDWRDFRYGVVSNGQAPAGTNLVKVSANEYDSGLVGDSNLTKTTLYPGGTAAERVTQNWYDWRNRLVINKAGVQADETGDINAAVQRQLALYTYDNLGQTLSVESYDADNLNPDASGGTWVLSGTGNRRSRATYEYDELGRVYRTNVFSVNEATGGLSANSLKSETWYDLRSSVIKQTQPGGPATKYVYDGTGRLIKTYVTDAAGDSTYSDASSVSNDTVLEQSESQLDKNGNVTMSITRQRFHDAGTGELTANNSRRYIVTYAYDNVDRLISTVDFGTNGGRDVDPAIDGTDRTNAIFQFPAGSDDLWIEAEAGDVVSGTGGSGSEYVIMTDPTASNDYYLVDPDNTPVQFNGTEGSSAAARVTYTFRIYEQATYRVWIRTWSGNSEADSVWAKMSTETDWALCDVTPMAYFAWNTIVDRDQGYATRTYSLSPGVHSLTLHVREDGLRLDKVLLTKANPYPQNEGGTASPTWERHVTQYAYNDAERQADVTDPRGLITRTTYDAMGRTVKTVENYVEDPVEHTAEPTAVQNRTTEYTYNGNSDIVTMKAVLPGGAFQTTEYIYGVDTAGGSDIVSNDLLREINYPDPSDGEASASQAEKFTYDALGQTKTKLDRNNTTHTYSYDIMGRLSLDEITFGSGSGVDQTVKALGYTYDTAGRPEKFTSYSSTGIAGLTAAQRDAVTLNQVQRQYNGLGQMTAEFQEHSGPVNLSSSLKVQYNYSEMSGGANHSRLVSMTYPNGRVLSYTYATGLDDAIGRLSSISDSSATLESYTYIGLGTLVKRAHPQTGVDLTYIGSANGEAGDIYVGLDRFGRIIDQRWATSGGVDKDRFKYGYDRDSNRLYELNTLYPGQSELYGYDGLNRLASFKRGTLLDVNGDGTYDTISGQSKSQSWGLDALGNWNTVTTDSTTVTREHDAQNRLEDYDTAVDFNEPAFDANGNMTRDQTGTSQNYLGATLRYDAWNRLVSYDSNATDRTFVFDALGRRVQEITGTTTTDLYQSAAWQVVEERVGTSVKSQFVWSPAFVDAMICRDRDADANAGNGLEERLYPTHDANFNITSLLDASGNTVERYTYLPYGDRAIFDASMNVRSSSAYNFTHGHQGGSHDLITGLIHFRHREYSTALGRWVQQDPMGYVDGMNRYQAYLGRPLTHRDTQGLRAADECPDCRCPAEVLVHRRTVSAVQKGKLRDEVQNQMIQIIKHGVKGADKLDKMGELAAQAAGGQTFLFQFQCLDCDSSAGRRVKGNVEHAGAFVCEPNGLPGNDGSGGFHPERAPDARSACEDQFERFFVQEMATKKYPKWCWNYIKANKIQMSYI